MLPIFNAKDAGKRRGSPSREPSPWEDTLIHAFRDLQWRSAIKSWLESGISQQRTFNGLNVDDAVSAIHPPPLLKLDGNAEKLGDVLTANLTTDQPPRFFLFEFKRDKATIGSEWKNSSGRAKWLALYMEALAGKFVEQTALQGYQKILEHTLRGHFLAYGITDPKEGFKDVSICAQPYFQAIGSWDGKPQEKESRSYATPFLKQEPSIHDLFSLVSDGAEINLIEGSALAAGLGPGEMGEYMSWLSEDEGHDVSAALVDTTGRVSMHIWNTNNFKNVYQALFYFQRNIDQKHQYSLRMSPSGTGSSRKDAVSFKEDQDAKEAASELCRIAAESDKKQRLSK